MSLFPLSSFLFPIALKRFHATIVIQAIGEMGVNDLPFVKRVKHL